MDRQLINGLFLIRRVRKKEIRLMKYLVNQESPYEQQGISWRHFMKITGASALGKSVLGFVDFNTKGISIVIDSRY